MMTQLTIELNECLDGMLSEADIEFDRPAHMVHRMNREQLLEQIAVCSDIYYGGSAPDFISTPIEDLADEQLRKLALWLYEEVGGTHSAV